MGDLDVAGTVVNIMLVSAVVGQSLLLCCVLGHFCCAYQFEEPLLA